MDKERLAVTITTNVTTEELPALETLINEAYRISVAGIILDTTEKPYSHVNASDLEQITKSDQILVARPKGDESRRIIGCIKVVPGADDLGEWSSLAVATQEQGKGVASQLIDAAEEALKAAGCKTAAMQLLAPVMWIQEHQERMRVYCTEKRGYDYKTGDFDTSTVVFDEEGVVFHGITLSTDAGFTTYTRAIV